jgi:uncharacterized protein
MKIDINRIPAEGLSLEEYIDAQGLELNTESINFSGPVKIKANIFKITNAVTVDMDLEARMSVICSRCLKEFESDFRKSLQLNYMADKQAPLVDLSPDIREEIILDYPLKPLCSPDCKGICPKCGRNLNKRKCDCVY